jgi:hypothetical protein
MPRKFPARLVRPLKLYATGHAVLLVGAWAMSATGSMLPMALAASACLMLTVPLVRHFLAPADAGR